MNQQPGNNISSVFNTIFNRSLTRITLPYQEEKRKQLEHFSDYYSNLFQSVVYYNHNNFEMEVMVVQPPGNTSHQSPAQAVERPRKQVERLFLLYVALFKSAVGKGLDFIDFSRFHITKENTIVVPATFESKNNSHLRPLHPPLTYFKQYTYFKKLTAKNYEHYFDRLKKKYIFNLSQAYLFRGEEFRSTILNTYTGLEQKSTINTKIRIKTSAPIYKDIIKFNIYSNNRGDDVLHLQIEEYPAGNIARRIAELIPKEPGAPVKPGMVPDKPGEAPPYDPNDLTKTLHQLNMYLKKSAIQTVIILIDHLKTREDAEFINYLIDSSGITGILLVVFDSPEIITYDLELNEAPTNQLEEYLIFDKGNQQEELNKDEIKSLKILEALPVPVPFEPGAMKKVFPPHLQPVVAHLVRRNILRTNTGNLEVNVALSALKVKLSAKEEVEILENCLEHFHTLNVALKYYVKTAKVKDLLKVLREFIRKGAPTETNFIQIKEMFTRTAGRDILALSIETVRHLVELLIKENQLEYAAELIEEHRERSPEYLGLKLAQIQRLRMEHPAMYRTLQELETQVTDEMEDEFYYLKYIYYEKTSDSKNADNYLKKLKKPLYIHLANIRLSDRYIFKREQKTANRIINEAVEYLSNRNFERDEIDARLQQAKLLRGKKEYAAAEKIYKNMFIRCVIKKYRLLSANISIDLGNLYINREEFNQAEVWYNKALTIFRELENGSGVNLAQSNLTDIYLYKGQWAKTTKYLEATLQFDKERKALDHLAVDYFNIANLEYLKHNPARALKALENARRLFDKRRNINGLIDCEYLELKLYLYLRIPPLKEPGEMDAEQLPLAKYRKRWTPDMIKFLTVVEAVLKKEALFNPVSIKENIRQIETQVTRFELVALLILNETFEIGGLELPDMLKTLSMELSMDTRSYFYYEYYYATLPTGEEELFWEVFYFFTRNKRKLSPRFIEFKKRLEEKDTINEMFENAQLVDDYSNWKNPMDFFESLQKELKKNYPVDMVGLSIYGKEKKEPLNKFQTPAGFGEIAGELVERAIKLKEPLDLGLEEVKVTSVSHEKAFYHYEKTRVVPWKISEKLFGVLVLAFIKDDQYGTDFCKMKRFKGILKKFASLINEYFKKEIKISKKLDWIVGKSPAINKVKETIVKVAKVDYPVLIRGESGSGKDLVARGVHQMSQRAAGPFVPVNAAAIPENLLEAELFGYKKGAFSGAAESKTGLIEAAAGGTLFLDEIAELPYNLQAKMLRVLQEQEIRRLGETRTITVDFRLICATNKNLLEMSKEGTFRGDLYYRFSDIPIDVPPLRERHGDIQLLVAYFLKKYNFEITDNDEMQRITAYFESRVWAGNVRELESAVKRLITFYPDFEVVEGVVYNPEPGLLAARENLEVSMVLSALRQSGWNKLKAADILKISRQHLFGLIRKYGIEKPAN